MPNNISALWCINTEDFFKGMGQQFVEIATGNFQGEAALVNGWEAQTAQAQANWGHSLAGMNTEQRAKAQGQWLGSDPGDAGPGNAAGSGRTFATRVGISRYESNSWLRTVHKGFGHILSIDLFLEPANSACWRVEA
ncbi:MAG: hypothetical protein Q8M51_16770 [Polaromonas sp.]|nr:hypothetical protein [Polaromonas sp.]